MRNGASLPVRFSTLQVGREGFTIAGYDVQPLAIDLFCGLGGWTEGLLAEGYYVVGFDIEQHVYGEHRYPAQLVIQDVLTLHGKQFKDATLIVGSSPCQEFSYRAMPWKRAKALGPPELGMKLFNAQFRIQREACEAAGRHIPMVVENVRGAIPWVGRSRWNYGSYHLWGDVPALMPMVRKHTKNTGGSWFAIGSPGQKKLSRNPDGRPLRNDPRDDIKCGGDWFGPGENSSAMRHQSSRSPKRKMASAMIAKIPEPLSRHIARCYAPPKEGNP